MDRDEALKLLSGGREGIHEFNLRRAAGEKIPDLTGTNHRDAYLRGANLSAANLVDAILIDANLVEVNLSNANLRRANLSGANLRTANLHGTHLNEADLSAANLSTARLNEADLSGAKCWYTVFPNVDLGDVKGLESIVHLRPSTIGPDTLLRSKGNIPETFLRGCGVADSLIEFLPKILNAMEPIQFYSCFISHSSKDQAFADRLHSRMVQEKLRVWYAPEDMPWGKKLHEEIDQAIRDYDKLLLVLSFHSLNSEWVRTEIRNALKHEITSGKRKLFPIRLIDYDALRDWKCFDADSRKDLGVEIREYIIPDFSNWKDDDAFETNFSRLLTSLKADQSAGLALASPPATSRQTPH
jgi:hypothetical protein